MMSGLLLLVILATPIVAAHVTLGAAFGKITTSSKCVTPQ
jgi:hypothetical protein